MEEGSKPHQVVMDTRVSEEEEFDFSPFYEIMKQSVDSFEDIQNMNYWRFLTVKVNPIYDEYIHDSQYVTGYMIAHRAVFKTRISASITLV